MCDGRALVRGPAFLMCPVCLLSAALPSNDLAYYSLYHPKVEVYCLPEVCCSPQNRVRPHQPASALIYVKPCRGGLSLTLTMLGVWEFDVLGKERSQISGSLFSVQKQLKAAGFCLSLGITGGEYDERSSPELVGRAGIGFHVEYLSRISCIGLIWVLKALRRGQPKVKSVSTFPQV
jgi:hypothetical protein